MYHRPVGTDAVTDTTIESTKYNINVADVEQDLNLPRPIMAGGTGATTPAAALLALSGETAKQVVTNYDSQVWLPGSFYSATTALGTLPVAAHAFAGIAYYANATDLVLEAADLTDVSDPTTIPQYIRVMTAGVWGAWTKKIPVAPIPGSFGEYTFNSGITFPPGSGQIRFNNATQNSTTEVFISHTTAQGIDNTGVIPFALKLGCDFYIQDKDEGTKFKMFTATADPVLSGGDFRVTVAFKSGGTDVVSAQRMLVGATGGGAVLYTSAQSLTAPQQIQARQNVYAAPFDAIGYSGMQINGAMDVSQERGTSGTTLNGGYALDGWRLSFLGTTMAMGAGQFAGQFPPLNNILAVNVTTAQTTLGSLDAAYIFHPMEGFRVSRLAFGTTNAQPITIGFWTAHSVSGTYSGAVRNSDATRSYVFTYTQSAAGVYQYQTVTVPGDTAGTWLYTTGLGLQLVFTLACGPAYSTATTGAWIAGNFIASTSQVNLVATINNVFRLTGVVVLPGTEAPNAARAPLVTRPFDQEILLCQRYYCKSFFNATLPANSTAGLWHAGYVWQATAITTQRMYLPVQMRTAPTITPYSPTTGTPVNGQWQYWNGAGYISSNTTSPQTMDSSFVFQLDATGLTFGQSLFCTGNWVANSRL